MNQNLLHTIYLAGAFLVLFTIAEIIYHKLKVKAEHTRKYVHIITGLLTMLFPPLLDNHWYVLGLCGSFFIILVSSIHFNLLKSINAVDRETKGSLLYPIIVYVCYIAFTEYNQMMFYYIPILILAICDPIAAVVGRRWPAGHYTTFGYTKTLSGSLGFFIAAILLSFILILSFEEMSLLTVIITSGSVALITVIAESITHKGYDNLSIPLSALLVLILLDKLL